MTINGINGVNTQMIMNKVTDSYSRNIQGQIANAEKQLQELSSNDNMTPEEKMKKRQEIQQKISELNMQLRQHQTEQRREKQQAKGSSMEDMLGGTKKTGSKSTGLSQASMTAMISADSSIKRAKVQGSVATGMKGKAAVLKSEIKNSHGGNVEKKREELADLEQKAQAATSSQLSALADANKIMEETVKAGSKDTKERDTVESTSGADTRKETVSGSESIGTSSGVFVSESALTETATVTPQPTAYKSVDIRL